MRTRTEPAVGARPKRSRFTILVLPVAAALVGAALAGSTLTRPRGPDGATLDAARTFLHNYVDPDGRVVRRDQGGDTVSEGQAYAMLFAVAVHDRERFDVVWRWTRTNLQQPDGTIAWHWANGAIVDRQSAADADLDMARALLVGATTFHAPSYALAARRISDDVLRTETASFGGRTVVVAGPWAVREGFVNPSYFAPRTFSLLHASTHDGRWQAVAEGSRAVMDELTAGGRLPPDWAHLDANGHATAGGPSGSSSYGVEAPRALLRNAEACDANVRDIAARSRNAAERAASDPVTLVGAAGSQFAAGDTSQAARTLAHAQSLVQQHPTYYGWAVVALGRIVLGSDSLGACPAAAP